MSVSTPAKIEKLRSFLATKPHKDILRIYLKNIEGGLVKHAVLVTVYRKWSTHPPFHLIEIGVTTYDRYSVKQGQPTMAGPHAENLLRHVWSLHLIIRPHAHLESATDHLLSFHFGTSVFVSQEEALDMLHQIWHQPMDEQDPTKGLRPIVYMSFGDNDGVAKTRKTKFDFEPASLPTTVAVLDAQLIPAQAKITRHATASFEYLLKQFKITPFHPGNSGNAAMYAMMIAILSVLRFELYAETRNTVGKPARTGQSSSKDVQAVVQSLMEWPTPAPPFGVEVYCWRCGSGKHGFDACPNSDLTCSRCEVSAHKWRRDNADTHMEGLCAFR
jgi:hypothetical protein